MTSSDTRTSRIQAMDLREIAAEIGEAPRTVWGWGLSTKSESVVVQPRSTEGVASVFKTAREKGIPVGLRGAGCSYGDACQNGGGVVMDLSRFNRIKSLDPETGILVAEPGVTLEQVWRHAIGKGYWPPVVSGTMYPTLGGLLSMNIHGKNNWTAGTIGEHIESFRMLTMAGEEVEAGPGKNEELFRAAIGGFGMLGCFTEITLKLAKTHSGYLMVEEFAMPELGHMICFMEQNKDDCDYSVGWVDCFPAGDRLGRNLIHTARYLQEGEDHDPADGLRESRQDLPKHFLGVLPKAWMWRFLKPFMNDFGMRAINAVKYQAGVRGQTRGRPRRQAHAAFAFLLDYVPDWKKAYGKGGLIQYQSFVPKMKAREVHSHLLSLCHRAGLVPYLGVYKRHRPDGFLMSHAVDGFSFAMDFKVTAENRERLWELTHRMDEAVLDAGGRFYFAKDATLLPATVHKTWPRATLDKFRRLKEEHDPRHLLQTNLSRRLFPEFREGADSGEQSPG